MIANRPRPGTTSSKSSSRLPARSAARVARPLTLPPGRARLATMPVPTGSPATAKTIGMTDVACFAHAAGEDTELTVRIRQASAVAHQAADIDKITHRIRRRQGVARCQCGQLHPPTGEESVRGDEQCV